MVDADHRATLVPCEPPKADAADDACAKTFFSGVGRLLFRRPLTTDELDYFVKAAHDGADTTKSFYDGLGTRSAEILFASTHADPKSKQLQDEELAFRASGKERRYSWDYDPEMDIYAYNEKTGALRRLTTARGYDAEGSYSPDGQWIVFSSMRDAYSRPLNDKEKKMLEENPSYFGEIYIMRADGSDQRRLTRSQGPA